MARFSFAKVWLLEGMKVRLPHWDKDSYWKLSKDRYGRILWSDGTDARVYLKQLEDYSWEIYKENKSLSDKIINLSSVNCCDVLSIREAVKRLKGARLCGKISDEKIKEIFGGKLA